MTTAEATTTTRRQEQQQQQQQQQCARSTGDELAYEAGISAQKSGCGGCLSVLSISAGLAARKCSPRLFSYCDAADESRRGLCGYVCAYAVGNTVRANQLLARPSAASVYDCPSRHVPGISLAKYVERFVQYTAAPKEVVVAALAYLDRFAAANRAGVVLAPTNVHRLLAVAFVVAAKFHCDQYNSNKYYARVAGLPLAELNALERAFLADVDYRLALTPDDYAAYAQPVEFLAAATEMYGDLVDFLAALVDYLRMQWVVQQRRTRQTAPVVYPPEHYVAAPAQQAPVSAATH